MSDSSSMRVLPEGINVVAVSPAVLVANIADWRNDHKGGGGRDKPRVFFLEDGEYKWITLLVEMLVIRACYIGIGAGHHRVYADSVLWIEVLPAAVSENLCEPMVSNVEPVELEVIEAAFTLIPKGAALAASMTEQPHSFFLTDKAREWLNAQSQAAV